MKVVFAFFVNTLLNFAIGLLVAKFLGPDQFGRFALAVAVGVVIQTAAFDWIRLTAVRFYSERSRSARPELRATLDTTFAVFACGLVALAFVAVFAGMTFALPQSLIGLAVAAAITNGLFDYNTALVRARFHDTLYMRLIITKNILALTLTVGGAFIFGSAQMALAGTCFSMAGSILLAREALRDPAAKRHLARRSLALDYMRYSLPIVAANFLYLMIPFINRALVTKYYGFAETGQFSLALDIGTRVMAAIGTALDVLLFQIAVRADELHGPEHAKEQVASNMAVVFAIMLPTTSRALAHPAEPRAPRRAAGVPRPVRALSRPAAAGPLLLRADEFRHQPDFPDRQTNGAADRRRGRRLRARPAVHPLLPHARRCVELRHRPGGRDGRRLGRACSASLFSRVPAGRAGAIS